MEMENTSRVIDISGQGINKLSHVVEAGGKVAALNADSNNLSTLRGIDNYASLIQLSVRDNHLVRMEAVASLVNLVTLNLQNNSITEIDGLERLMNLQWLCLAGNSIKEMRGLSSNLHLNHLDLSDNCISRLYDISSLLQLKTLLLHGNAISTLQRVGQFLPATISTLSLAENDVTDLNELSFLSSLKALTQLSVMNNPCVALTDPRMMFDYRPYVLYWCPALTTLDGISATTEERQRSATLFSSSQDYPFSLGQHHHLVQYLTAVSPLSTMQMVLSSSNGFNNSGPNWDSRQSPPPAQQADLVQKLKALEAVQQMIAEQEQLLRQQQLHASAESLPLSVLSEGLTNMDGSNKLTVATTDSVEQDVSLSTARSDLRPLPPTTSDHPSAFELDADTASLTTMPTTLEGSSSLPLIGGASSPPICMVPLLPPNVDIQEPVNTEVSESDRTQLTAERVSAPLRLCSARDDGQRLKSHGGGEESAELALQEQKQSQLRLLNAKIAQRRLQHMHPSGTTSHDTLQRRSKLEAQHVHPSHTAEEEHNLETSVMSSAGTEGVEADYQTQELLGSLSDASKDTVIGLAPPQLVKTISDMSRAEITSESLASNLSVSTGTALTSAYLLSSQPSIVVTSTHPQRQAASDVSKLVRPVEYRLPGVPSYDAPPVPTRQASSVKGGIQRTWSHPIYHSKGTQQLGVGVEGQLSADRLESRIMSGSLMNEQSSTTSIVHGQHMGALTRTSALDSLSDVHPDLDVLVSTSYYIPVPPCGDNSLDKSQFDVGAFTTSLTQAYGISNPAETSQLLSSLVGDDSKDSMGLNHDPNPGPSLLTTVGGMLSDTKEHPSESIHTSTTADGMDTAAAISRSHSQTNHQDHPEQALSQSAAAIRIQSAMRGYSARRRLQPYIQKHKAATVIQAAWRGYVTRTRVPEVVEVRRELYKRKLEGYVTTLYLQLQGCRQELAHQAHMVQLQEETVGSLLQEVDSLLSWKAKVESDTRNKAALVIQKYWKGYRVRKVYSYSGKSHKDTLWTLYTSLKGQVDDLQATLSSVMENMYVFGETRQRFQKMGFIEPLSDDTSQGFTPGADLPVPTELQMSHFSESCVLVQWSPTPATYTTAVLQGYRVYVNGNAEGMVGAAKSKAYIEGLNPNTTYRITIRALYDAGESPESTPIVASLTSSKLNDVSSSESSDTTSHANSPTATPTNETGINSSKRDYLEGKECEQGIDAMRREPPEHIPGTHESWKQTKDLVSEHASADEHSNSSLPPPTVPLSGEHSALVPSAKPQMKDPATPGSPLSPRSVSTSPRDMHIQEGELLQLSDKSEAVQECKPPSSLESSTTIVKRGGMDVPALRFEPESTMNSEKPAEGVTVTGGVGIQPHCAPPPLGTFDTITQAHPKHMISLSDNQGSILSLDYGQIAEQKYDSDENTSYHFCETSDTSTHKSKHMATPSESVSSDRKAASDYLQMDTPISSKDVTASLEGITAGDNKHKGSFDEATDQLPTSPKLTTDCAVHAGVSGEHTTVGSGPLASFLLSQLETDLHKSVATKKP